jgi:acyl dehydratase
MPGRYLDQFLLGETHTTPSRTITEADVATFAGVTGDYNEIHMSEEYAKKSLIGKRIAHGLLLLSISHGLLSRLDMIDGTGIGFAEIENWKFKSPVFFNDTVHVKVTVTEIKNSRTKLDRGILKLFLQIINQRDEVVQEGTKVLMMQRLPSNEKALKEGS